MIRYYCFRRCGAQIIKSIKDWKIGCINSNYDKRLYHKFSDCLKDGLRDFGIITCVWWYWLDNTSQKLGINKKTMQG